MIRLDALQGEAVLVGVLATRGVLVAVLVFELVGELVGVLVAVLVLAPIGLLVGELVGELVAVLVLATTGLLVGEDVGELVGVLVGERVAVFVITGVMVKVWVSVIPGSVGATEMLRVQLTPTDIMTVMTESKLIQF